MKPNAPRIKLNVDRLVLDGAGHIDRRALHAAIEQELARLVAEHGAPAGPGADGPWRPDHRVAAGPGATASEIGARIARAIYGGIGGRAG